MVSTDLLENKVFLIVGSIVFNGPRHTYTSNKVLSEPINQ